MDEIIDLEEVTVEDETLKDFMKKDEEAEKELNDKIDELSKEEEKLTKKEEELKSLEEKSREKINTDASADELIEIAGKIKEVEEELSSIKENIETLSKEKEELLETKKEIETSKKEYIKSLNQASSSYKEQLKKISEAIEVCDNPTLKQVLEDVQNKKNEELTELSEKRISELRKVLKEDDEVKDEVEISKEKEDTKEEKPTLEIETPVEEEKKDEIIVPTLENVVPEPIIEPVVETPQEIQTPSNDVENTISSIDDLLSSQLNVETPQNNEVTSDPFSIDLNIPEEKPILETPSGVNIGEIENKSANDMINLDSILSSNIDSNVVNPINSDINVIPKINQPEIKNDNKYKIIYEKNVPNNLLRDIFSSSKIMPFLDKFLENQNEGSFI